MSIEKEMGPALEQPPALPLPSAAVCKVLLADGSPSRSDHFSISGPAYHYRVVRSAADLIRTLQEPAHWDLLFHACYLGDWRQDVLYTVPAIREAFYAKKLRGVICIASVEGDAKKFVGELRSQGIPCKWYPFSYAKPADHVENLLEDFPLVVKETH